MLEIHKLSKTQLKFSSTTRQSKLMQTTHVLVNNQKLIKISYIAHDFAIQGRESATCMNLHANVNRELCEIAKAAVLISKKIAAL